MGTTVTAARTAGTANALDAQAILVSDSRLSDPTRTLFANLAKVYSDVGVDHTWRLVLVVLRTETQPSGTSWAYSFTLKFGTGSAVPQLAFRGDPGPTGPQGEGGVGPPGPPGPAGPSTGPAGGDLRLSYPDPELAKIQTYPVDMTGGPSVGDTIVWDGTNFVPGPAGGGTQFAISSFVSASGTLFEVGESVVTPAFTAAYTILPTSASLDDSFVVTPLTTPFASFNAPGTYVNVVNGATNVFVLSATKVTVATRTLTFTWAHRLFHGNSTIPGVYDEAFVEGLSGSYLSTSRTSSFSDTAAVGEYVHLCLPSSYGIPTFTVGVLPGGFSQVASGIMVTNPYAVGPESYDVYRTDNHSLGLCNVNVT